MCGVGVVGGGILGMSKCYTTTIYYNGMVHMCIQLHNAHDIM